MNACTRLTVAGLAVAIAAGAVQADVVNWNVYLQKTYLIFDGFDISPRPIGAAGWGVGAAHGHLEYNGVTTPYILTVEGSASGFGSDFYDEDGQPGYIGVGMVLNSPPKDGIAFMTELHAGFGVDSYSADESASLFGWLKAKVSTYDVEFKDDGSWYYQFEGSTYEWIRTGKSDPVQPSDMVMRVGTVVGGGTPTFYGLWTDGVNASGQNMTYDSVEDEWTGSSSATNVVNTDTLDASCFSVSFSDDGMDVDGDGRFNYADLAELATMIDDPVPDGSFFDIGADGYVDQEDYDAMEDILDAGLGSGIFGDLDQDSDADLADYIAACGSFASDYTIADAAYVIELDEDVDAVVDNDDLLQFRGAVFGSDVEGDCDHDEDVDSSDLGILLAAFDTEYGDPGYNAEADLNCDCFVNNSDLGILLANY